MEQQPHDTRTLFEDGAALRTRKTFVLALGALLGVGGLMFAFEEELLLFGPRLGERGVELLTSGFTGLLAAGGLVLVMRRQGKLLQRVTRIATERQQIEDLLQGLTEETKRLSVTHQEERQHISQLQAIERSLQASESEFRALLAAMTDVFLVIDSSGRYLKIAPTNPALLHKPSAELLGKTFHDVFPPEQAEQFLSSVQRALATRQTVSVEYALTMAGTQVWFAAAVSPLEEHTVIWVARDISERKRVEERLEAERTIAAALASVGQELIAVRDTPPLLERLCRVTAAALQCDASYTWLWNPHTHAFVPLAGYGDTPEQWETLRMFSVTREELSDIMTRLEHDAIAHIDLTQRPQLSPGLRAAVQFGASVSLGIALRRGGELIGIQTAGYRRRAGVFAPTSERIARGIAHLASLALTNAQLLEAVESANRLKADFFATLSHELRNPLHIILGYTELLQDEHAAAFAPELRDILGRIHRAARDENELVTTMLDLSRLESGHLPLDVQEVRVAELLAEIQHDLAPEWERSGLAFEWNIPAALEPLVTDRLKLKIVLKNLLSNALKFTRAGRVATTTQARDGGVEFCVSDTGNGIAPELLPHIFEMFRQGEQMLTRQEHGVGLGLYIVRRMVELLGGTIAVESAVDKGSTFRVWVPMGRLQGRKEPGG